jgi:LmbE family N-acetylglucosaminyl deacetylase
MYVRRVLILIPHPDDEVVGACAEIRRARAAGARIFGFYLTNGVPAREVFWPWRRGRHAERVAQRWREADAAADLLQIENAGRCDWPSRTLRLRIAEAVALVDAALAATQALAIWVPAFEGAHQDHDVANLIASRFHPRVDVWEFAEYNFAGGMVRTNEFFAPDGTELERTLDQAEQEFKRKALALYASERANLAHIRVEREVFRPQPTFAYDYARPPHPGPPFWARYRWARLHPRVDATHPDDVRKAMADYLARAR